MDSVRPTISDGPVVLGHCGNNVDPTLGMDCRNIATASDRVNKISDHLLERSYSHTGTAQEQGLLKNTHISRTHLEDRG